MKIFASILVFLAIISCASTPTPRQAELVVTYNGQEVHRAGSKYASIEEVHQKTLEKGKKYFIFAARWCKSCDFLEKALEQSGHRDIVTLIDIDDAESRKVAAALDIRNVPTMVVVDEKDKISDQLIGPSAIVMHMLIHVDKKNEN